MNIKNIKKGLFFIIPVLILIQAAYASNNLQVTTKYDKKEVCPCTTIVFEFEIKNTGTYPEVYTLAIDKEEFKPWITLSDNNILLKAGEKKKVYSFITPDCSFYGTHDLNFYIKAITSETTAKVPVELNIKPCYDYEVALKEYTGLYSVCENEVKSIPVTINNKADYTNTYTLKLKAPKWANLEYNNIRLPSNQKSTINIILAPPLGLEDKFTFALDVLSERGNIKQNIIFNVEADNCYIPDIEKTKFSVGYEDTYSDLGIINTGSKTASYLLVLEAPSWITLQPNNIAVQPQSKKTVKLHTTPTEETKKGKYKTLLTIVVNENNSQYQYELTIKLTKPSIFAKLLLYFLLILLILLVMLIIILAAGKIKKIEKPPKEVKPVKEIVEKKIVEKKAKIEKKPVKKLTKKTKRRIALWILLFLIAWLVAFNLFALKHKLTFEVPKNITIPEVIKEVPKPEVITKLNVTYFENAKDKIINASSVLWNFIKLYYLYIIIGIILLAILILFIILIRKKLIKIKSARKPKEKKVVEKKIVEKKVKPKKIKKRKKRIKIPKKTLKRLLWIFLLLLILLLLALYVALNYQGIGIQKAEENFFANFFHKTKNFMDQSLNIPLHVNITKLIKPEKELPEMVFEKGIPPQKWAKNTIHRLDLSKYFSDPDRDKLNYASTRPKNISVEINGSIVTLNPKYNWTGVETITFVANDGKGGTAKSNSVYLVVQEKTSISTKFNNCKTKVVDFFIDVKDYFLFYLNYIITGFVILIILILIIKYNKKMLKFLEEEKQKKKR